MPSPVETVKAFSDELNKGREAGVAALQHYFLPDAVWEMVGVATMIGPGDAIAAMHKEYDAIGAERLQIDFVAIAADGDTVLTERVDRLIAADGTEIRAPRIMGVFEVQDGRFRAVREYFDTAALAARSK
jgi:limonene-1,2-epoxide hydrolase